MSAIIGSLAIGALFGTYGLRVNHDPIEHPPNGALRYSGYDRGGMLIIKGWIVINLYGFSEAVGEWCLDRVGDPENTGPQVGRGSLHGSLDGAELSVSLNPGFVDFHVLLTGVYLGTSFKGIWRYATVKRTVNEGSFEATRQDEEPDARL